MGFWDDHNRVVRLRRMWGRGLTGAHIAKRLKTSTGAVMGKLYRLGLLGKLTPQQRADRIAKAGRVRSAEEQRRVNGKISDGLRAYHERRRSAAVRSLTEILFPVLRAA